MIMKRTSLLFASCALALAAAAVPARPVVTFEGKTISESTDDVIEKWAGTALTMSSEGATKIEWDYNTSYYFYGSFIAEHHTNDAPFTATTLKGGGTYTIYGVDDEGNRSEPLSFYLRVNQTVDTDEVTAENFELPVVGKYYTVDSDLNTTRAISTNATVAQNAAKEFVLTDVEDTKSGFVVTNNNTELVIKKLTIGWGDEAVVGETTVEIYGKKLESYGSAADLYDADKQGTLLATVVCTGATDVLTFDAVSERDFIGLRAVEGEVTIKKLTAVWTYSLPDAIEPEQELPDKLEAGDKLSWVINGYGAIYGVTYVNGIPNQTDWTFDEPVEGKAAIKRATYTVPADVQSLNLVLFSHNMDNDAYLCTRSMYFYNIGSNGNVSGVEDIDADNDAEAEYYNLQGVRVAADGLTPGIYIRRLGNSVTKVVIR